MDSMRRPAVLEISWLRTRVTISAARAWPAMASLRRSPAVFASPSRCKTSFSAGAIRSSPEAGRAARSFLAASSSFLAASSAAFRASISSGERAILVTNRSRILRTYRSDSMTASAPATALSASAALSTSSSFSLAPFCSSLSPDTICSRIGS
jgi:hypothetical protein